MSEVLGFIIGAAVAGYLLGVLAIAVLSRLMARKTALGLTLALGLLCLVVAPDLFRVSALAATVAAVIGTLRIPADDE